MTLLIIIIFLFLINGSKTEDPNMKQLVGLHGPLGVNVDATMWHDYLGEFPLLKCIHIKLILMF